ncbi:MAG: hypothetical protein ACR2P0_13550 [Acidimicrobiales bacterium]
MTRNAHLLSLLLTALMLGGIPADSGSPTTEPAAASVGPVLGELTPHTKQQAEIVAAATGLFTEAGLMIDTEVVASFHDSTDDCAGNLGYWMDEDGVDRVRVCWTHDDEGVEAIVQTQALVHELAHAWVHRSTTESTRAAFIEFSGSTSWNAADSEWNDRATERAADLITWAILDPAVLFVEFEGESCHRWAAAYELLTSQTAPTAIADSCA